METLILSALGIGAATYLALSLRDHIRKLRQLAGTGDKNPGCHSCGCGKKSGIVGPGTS